VTRLGGQAVIEGVMLTDGQHTVLAVRTPQGGIQVEPLQAGARFPRLERVPFVRGPVKLYQLLVQGWAALQRSAAIAYPEEAPKESGWELWLMIGLLFVVVVGGFMVLPMYLASLLPVRQRVLYSLIEGGIRVVLFVLYIAAISLLRDVRRVFQYHGAEHKVVHAFEEGEGSLERARGQSPVHPRCGSSFVLLFLVVAVLVFSLVPTGSLALRLASRIVLIPVVAGVTYEILQYAGRHPRAWWLRPLVFPGLLLQRLTTREPSTDQLEVALAALHQVVAERNLSTSS